MRNNTDRYAAVTGYHANYRTDTETETEVAVTDVTDRSRTVTDQPAVEFELFWGKSANRAFVVRDDNEVRALARVLAAALGTTLADDADMYADDAARGGLH